MNLHGIANGYVAAVNPNVTGTLYVSAAATTNPDGSRVATWTAFTNVPMQVQALSGRDLRQTEGLNLQGILRAVYLFGAVEGVSRPTGKGGDVLTFANKWWLVSTVLEPWSDTSGWTKVAVTLQNGAPAGLP